MARLFGSKQRVKHDSKIQIQFRAKHFKDTIYRYVCIDGWAFKQIDGYVWAIGEIANATGQVIFTGHCNNRVEIGSIDIQDNQDR